MGNKLSLDLKKEVYNIVQFFIGLHVAQKKHKRASLILNKEYRSRM